MSDIINKKSLEHLAALARIEFKKGEEDKMLKDMEAILEHFKELQKVDTTGVEPMTGGTLLRSITREDAHKNNNTRRGVELFPDSLDGYLKVPNVFD
ncbi:MAG: aspartyl-tRNA(Asn)/glutamyl-tRNA (Gln) amidotransferase subunit C [Parcubacteria group bacterium Athens0714_26]|nr:MAG: aspartyl-tRNA(Asn)/glutamyl-tRNA (Gln) amidotransferase subunit C [Parcubacteria group bacterium Athens1014_26]TSD03624.1 MAG: aspartyl-tRNA(Asn)/glutamyl-tRNA (Gln) amidotransferase subunit C [Parcubacteria group bacterium Athens0714_26]